MAHFCSATLVHFYNAIDTDFYSNEPEQIKLQEIMARLGYFYEIKRGDRKFLENGKETHNLLGKKKSEFKFWDEKLDIEKLASLWMAYSNDPALDKIQKSNIFGYAKDKYYDCIFEDAEKVSEEQVKEMILANNLFEAISREAAIYGNTTKRGQIISKISQIKPETKDHEKTYENINSLVQNSSLFGELVKKDVGKISTFFDNKEQILKQIKKYQFFSTGRYLTLATFKLVLDKCDYIDGLIKETELFSNKEYVEKKIIGSWLKKILDEIILKEYEEFDRNVGSSLKAFYTRNSTWEGVQNRMNELRYNLNEDYREIFPLKV